MTAWRCEMGRRVSHAAIVALCAWIAAGGVWAQDWQPPGVIVGRVVGVADGDTVTVLDATKRQHRIRVAGIDAPERGQPGGFRSKESLAALVYGQPVRVESEKRDRYGRIVGKVWTAPPDSPCRSKPGCPMTLDAGLEQIRQGRAWWFRKYADEQSAEDRRAYAEAESEARATQLGMWRDGEPMPPWEWRKNAARRP